MKKKNEISGKMRYTVGEKIREAIRMTMPKAVRDALSTLLEALGETPQKREMLSLREKVFASEVNGRLLQRYFDIQRELQGAALQDTPADEALMKEFEKLNLVLFEDEEISAYLMARMRWQQLLSAVLEELVDDSGER